MFSLNSSYLAGEYRRWCDQINEVEASSQFTETSVTATEVLQSHFALVDYFMIGPTAEQSVGIGGIGPRSLHLLQSAVFRQFSGFGGSIKHADKFEECATLFYGLIRNHAFHDCNKRTALLTALYQLAKGGRVIDTEQKELDKLAISTAEHSLASRYTQFAKFQKEQDSEVKFIAYFFKKKTRDVDTKSRTITYSILNTNLGRFGFEMSNLGDNKVDIYKIAIEDQNLVTRIFGGPGKQIRKKIGTVGCHSWKSQVPKKVLKQVIEFTELTPENGVDSAVLFDGIEPLRNLIEQYEGPLRRLANK